MVRWIPRPGGGSGRRAKAQSLVSKSRLLGFDVVLKSHPVRIAPHVRRYSGLWEVVKVRLQRCHVILGLKPTMASKVRFAPQLVEFVVAKGLD